MTIMIRSLLLVVASSVLIIVGSPTCAQKIQTTRTALHVARSLDPNSMESVPVKTRAGDLTTIIVKKRQGKSSNVSSVEGEDDASLHSTAATTTIDTTAATVNTTADATNYVLLSSSSSGDTSIKNANYYNNEHNNNKVHANSSKPHSTKIAKIMAIPYGEYNSSGGLWLFNHSSSLSSLSSLSSPPPSSYSSSAAAQNRTDRGDTVNRIRVPEPVYVSSSMVFVKNELNNNNNNNNNVAAAANKKGRSLIKLDADGIPVVTGVRVPDDDSDRQVWRNARVINGILVPYDKADKDIGATKTKPARKPSTVKPSAQFLSSLSAGDDAWMKIGAVTKKPTKLSPAALSFMKQETWNDQKWDLYRKPATLKPRPSNLVTASSSASIGDAHVLQTIEANDDGVDRSRPSSSLNGAGGSANSATAAYTQHPLGLWVPADTEENPEHKYVTDRILEYIRNINKEEMKRLSMQKFTVRDARMLSTSATQSQQQQQQPPQPDQQQQPQIQSRILHVPGASVFPNSAMYSPSTQPPSRVSFEEGVRTPVLQYAHPELGVQSAKAEPTHGELVDSKKATFYPEDIHADRGPFVFEPAAPSEQANGETMSASAAGVAAVVAAGNNQRSHTAAPYFQRPKKTLAYFYPEKHVYATPPDNKYYAGKFPPLKDDYKLTEYPTIYYEDMDGRPFWIRFGDSLKEQVQTGIDKVTDLTRPVVEPLVEATHKISQNLGLSSGNRDLSTIREKLGTVSTSSLILPAIGIVAGGAALGLGAVAVGRYLNYDVVKMRSGKSLDMDKLQILNPTDAAQLEQLWTEDRSRSAGEPSATTSTEAPAKTRRRRSTPNRQNTADVYLENVLQTLDSDGMQQQTQMDVYPSSVWSNTPCSKRIFCEAMLLQSEDSISLMDKKIYTFLSIIHPDIAVTVAPHLEEVMRSVKMKNCSAYTCSTWKPSTKPKINVDDT